MKRRTINCMLLFAAVVFSITAFAQGKRTISGVVTDSANKPLSGISVLIKGTKTGTVTNENGQFSINASSGNVLVFTFVGYRSQELTLGSSSTYNIQMVGSVIQLTDVVVTALGIKREKRSLGYAVSTVNKDELELRPEADLGRVLSGKVPGLDITSTSGLSGSGTNINIRGISTITGNSAPLFVVDGVPFDGSTNAQANFTYGHQTSSRFLDLDPNNIENVSVLKGLTAVTLYGEEGRNGVILVTTKNGATQRTRKKAEITVSQSYFRTKPILPEYNTKYGGGFDLASVIAFFSNL
ncbi:MAG: TonB-dependent receptor plug domain-containing protein [Chitinophagaceae bacterium]|jgi:TonB-dependent SusC/RagA subfamily outer membrane receptor|nr:TonB-dependent receptor plug domain-containing protein [Chitinophagaceae bacterium]